MMRRKTIFYLSFFFNILTSLLLILVGTRVYNIEHCLSEVEHHQMNVLSEPFKAVSTKEPTISTCRFRPESCSNVIPRQSVELRGTQYWVMYNLVMGRDLFACHETITYTTHGDFTFFKYLEALVNRWQGPVSFAIYAPDEDFNITMKSIAHVRQCGSELVSRLVTFHVVFDTAHIPPNVQHNLELLQTPSVIDCNKESPPWTQFESIKNRKKIVYPINVVRNVARQTVMTHFVLASDIELFPSKGLIPSFMQMMQSLTSSEYCDHPAVFVLSIFEVEKRSPVPEYKSQLVAMLRKGSAIPFHTKMCHLCHKVPKYSEWLRAPVTDSLSVFHTARRDLEYHFWEPIFIGTNNEPLYDERLSWNGKKDKMAQAYLMCSMDYLFKILNNAFLVHSPGIKKIKRDSWRDGLVAQQSKFVVNHVKKELDNIFPINSKCTLH